jgi:hypothetical protein
MRDERADYLAAYKTTYESCVQAGRTEDADRIAQILRDDYDHDVAAPERADEQAPENTAEPKPARRKTTPRSKPAE